MLLEDSDRLALAKARAFCIAGHAAINQTRQYTGEPYHEHPFRVAALVREHALFWSVDQLVACYLHDLAEDTKIPIDLIAQTFNKNVASLVDQITNVSIDSSEPRSVRLEINLAHLSVASPAAQTIKCADAIDNLRDIVEHNLHFAKTYVAEKRRLHGVLTQADAQLRDMLLAEIMRAEKAIHEKLGWLEEASQ